MNYICEWSFQLIKTNWLLMTAHLSLFQCNFDLYLFSRHCLDIASSAFGLDVKMEDIRRVVFLQPPATTSDCSNWAADDIKREKWCWQMAWTLKHVRRKHFPSNVLLIRCFPEYLCVEHKPSPSWGWDMGCQSQPRQSWLVIAKCHVTFGKTWM